MRSSYLRSLAFFVCLLFTVSTKLCAQKLTAFDQLKSVNATWKDQPDIDPGLYQLSTKDLSEQDLIRLHLQKTEELLRMRNPKGLTAAQRKNREANLNILHSYWQRGIFPYNDMHIGKQPYFIDKFNTYCAAGYLMQQSGADKMARDINRTQNFDYLIDITHPDLMNWVYNSGLTLDELALIQPAYSGDPCLVTEIHYNNAGTDVNEYIEVMQHDYVAQRFQSIRFYDHTGTLYKTLLKTEMQMFIASGHEIYHYLFPANESLADSGRIEFWTATSILSGEFRYNSSGTMVIDYTPFASTPSKFFPDVVEDGNTPMDYSLTFCGQWRTFIGSTWLPTVTNSTVGFLNACTVMAIGLSDFDYTSHEKSVELKWRTGKETNSDHFVVERSSDGINFSAIGTIRAAGTSNTLKQYSFTDNNPAYLNHYRLKMVNMDGTFTHSEILYVKFKAANPVRIVTNPVNKVLGIDINSNAANAGNIYIYDFHGRKMMELKAKAGRQDINVSAFSSGKYMIQFQTADGKSYNQAFIKK